MTTPDPEPARTTASLRLVQPAPSGWVPPAPLVVTDFQWRLNCLKANVEPREGVPWPWLAQPRETA